MQVGYKLVQDFPKDAQFLGRDAAWDFRTDPILPVGVEARFRSPVFPSMRRMERMGIASLLKALL